MRFCVFHSLSPLAPASLCGFLVSFISSKIKTVQDFSNHSFFFSNVWFLKSKKKRFLRFSRTPKIVDTKKDDWIEQIGAHKPEMLRFFLCWTSSAKKHLRMQVEGNWNLCLKNRLTKRQIFSIHNSNPTKDPEVGLKAKILLGWQMSSINYRIFSDNNKRSSMFVHSKTTRFVLARSREKFPISRQIFFRRIKRISSFSDLNNKRRK